MKVSVIVPVYNTYDYLKQCIESILNQTLTEYELILIDDGSTDRSGELCDFYSRLDSRIKVIHQENKGIAAARNRGIKEAKGEYISFIDSDDYIEKDFLQLLYNSAVRDDLDIVFSGYYYLQDEIYFELNKQNSSLFNQVMTGKEFFCQQMNLMNYINVEVWDDLYKREFLLNNNLYFIEGIYYEDEEFSTRILLFAERVKYIPEKNYVYRQREGSVMNSGYSLKHINSLYQVIQSLIRIARLENNKELKFLLNQRINQIVKMLISRFSLKKHRLNLKKFNYSEFNYLLFNSKIGLKNTVKLILIHVKSI